MYPHSYQLEQISRQVREERMAEAARERALSAARGHQPGVRQRAARLAGRLREAAEVTFWGIGRALQSGRGGELAAS